MSAVPKTPQLEQGDRLSRAEFERRYHALPDLKKAELIEGVVHMPSPVRWRQHSNPHFCFLTWLGTYSARTPGVEGGDNGSIRLDLENEPQPDGMLLLLPSHGGRARISEDDYIEGAPELVGEISASSVSIDLNAKFRVYQRNGVREYIVWRVLDREIDWFVLRESDFTRLQPGSDGILRSEIFPGLWLDAAAMTRSDLAAVLDALQRGLSSPEHAEYVACLQAHAANRS